MKKKTFYTNETLFNAIIGILKDKNLLPTSLDYWLPERYKVIEFRNYEWDCTADLQFGGSEGIYLDIYAVGYINSDEKQKVRLGVFKTLGESREHFYEMAKLQADFIWEVRDFVNEHIEEFEE
ncbi:MAG: hypothetical protein UIM53_06010 [Acutalibacteraceae bacterium]|nr:hypothetical protein [Acutalibacteraceae bacterium]